MSRAPAPARALLIAVAVVVLQAALVSWFAWPATQLEPRDLPVAVAGRPPASAAIAAQLAAARPGAFKVTTVADAAAADALLRDRAVYAAFVITPTGPSLHVASAASPTVAALLTQAAAQLGGTAAPTVVDVVPGSSDDPRGAGFASGFLPLVLLGLVASVLLVLLVGGWSARLLGVVSYAVLSGLVGAAVMRALGLVSGDYLAVAGAIGLLALAVCGGVTGLGSLVGRPGVAAGVLLVFLLANPISAVAAAPELLPTPWGAFGQFFPPGAGASLLRSVAFFGGAGMNAPLWTLVAWAVVGLVLVVVGRARPVAGPEATAE